MERNKIEQFNTALREYRAGKQSAERRVINAENWWRLRNAAQESRNTEIGKDGGFTARTAWLHNIIVSKHADAMDAFPEPDILPREERDTAEAESLGDIIPCVLEQNGFEQVYSDVMWQKLKTGTGIYKVVWDPAKLNGLGDISIVRVDLLNLFWEPGITDIQKSKYLFHTELHDIDELEETYPHIRGRLRGGSFNAARFAYEGSAVDAGKVTVAEVYYRRVIDGRRTLQYCKFCGDEVLYATEDDPELYERGLYDHAEYPFVFDPLFPVEGSPCGYGYVDLSENTQTAIDLMMTAFIKNTMAGSVPRYFVRGDGGLNEEEFLDLSKPIVHTSGNLGEDAIRQITFSPLAGSYIQVLETAIEEIRHTSGNTETATGNPGGGVTAASAIAALQEASGKTSRDSAAASYRAYRQVIYLCIELIRQFYSLPRQFRITGKSGEPVFRAYSNEGLQPVREGDEFGTEAGCRLPVFDIRVRAQKKSAVTKLSQNELALQLFRLGFFNPQAAPAALPALNLMSFEGRDGVIRQVAENYETARLLAAAAGGGENGENR